MANPSFTQDDLAAGGLLDPMIAIAIDPSGNFLNGNETSTFKAGAKAAGAAVGGAATIAAGAAGMAAVGVGTALAAPEIAVQLTAMVVEKVTSAAMAEVARVTQEVAALPVTIPQKISQATQKAFNENKKSLSEIMKEVETDVEKQNDEKQEKADKDQEEKSKNGAKEKLEKGTKKINEVVGTVQGKMAEITQYIASGPAWVTNKVNSLIDEKIKIAKDAADQAINDAKQDIDKFCQSKGEKLGLKMADKYNETLRKQVKDKLAKIEKKKKEAKIKANTAMQKGILKAMALTGINIPFSPSA